MLGSLRSANEQLGWMPAKSGRYQPIWAAFGRVARCSAMLAWFRPSSGNFRARLGCFRPLMGWFRPISGWSRPNRGGFVQAWLGNRTWGRPAGFAQCTAGSGPHRACFELSGAGSDQVRSGFGQSSVATRSMPDSVGPLQMGCVCPKLGCIPPFLVSTDLGLVSAHFGLVSSKLRELDCLAHCCPLTALHT